MTLITSATPRITTGGRGDTLVSQEDIPYVKGDILDMGRKIFTPQIFRIKQPQQTQRLSVRICRLGEIESYTNAEDDTPGHVLPAVSGCPVRRRSSGRHSKGRLKLHAHFGPAHNSEC